MNHETFSYTLFTAGFGMLVVFFFLALLSVLMVVIKRAFDDRRTTEPTAPAAVPSDESARDLPRWVTAAVVAYLAVEERMRARPAAPWTQRR